MTEPYTKPVDHLRDERALARLLFHRAIATSRPDAIPPAALAGAELDTAIRELVNSIGQRLAHARATGRAMPLDRVATRFGLTLGESRVVNLLIALELDAELRELARFITADPARSEPDVGLLQRVLYQDDSSRLVEELRPDAPLFRFALATDVDAGRDAAFVLRRVRATARLLELAHGHDRLDRALADIADVVVAADPLEPIEAQRDARAKLAVQLAAAISAVDAGRMHPAIVLVGRERSGRTALAVEAALAIERPVLRVRCERLPTERADVVALGRTIVREAIWLGAIVLLAGADRMSGEPVLDRLLLRGIAGPVVATVTAVDRAHVRFDRGVVTIQIDEPAEADRAVLWQRSLASAELVDWAAARYALAPGGILAAAASATAGGPPTRETLHEAVRAILERNLATLATRVTWRQRWEDVVLPEDTLLEVREMVARIAHRRQVHDDWGFGDKVAKGLGLTALFTGPPGTGKTMVAGLIADELGLDLYQVDLSRIVSKWIGETEKNLAELFDAAETGHAILLFDEADSLFAKRTSVSSSVDRYANLEVNYLLQRMEAFRGISILTTNHDTAIDDAFRRRLSCRIEFPVPEVDERLRLWESLLPARAIGNARLDLARMADKYVMSGGYIRNAVLRAAFLAADEGTTIMMKHLVRAANLEYAGFGKVMA